MPQPPNADDGGRPVRVRILGREYPLRVRPGDEALTRDMAAYVDGKLRAFKDAHPEQSDMTAAVVVALALAEELYLSWEERDAARADHAAADAAVEDALDALEARLAGLLDPTAGTVGEGAGGSEQDGDASV